MYRSHSKGATMWFHTLASKCFSSSPFLLHFFSNLPLSFYSISRSFVCKSTHRSCNSNLRTTYSGIKGNLPSLSKVGAGDPIHPPSPLLTFSEISYPLRAVLGPASRSKPSAWQKETQMKGLEIHASLWSMNENQKTNIRLSRLTYETFVHVSYITI